MTSEGLRLSGASSFGAARSMLAAAGVAVLLNGGLMLFDDKIFSVNSRGIPRFAPPGWLVGCVWVVLFALLGLVRWRLLRSSSTAARKGARWALTFIIVCAAYPVYTLGLRSLIAGLVGNLGTAFLAVVLGVQAKGIDNLSAGVYALVAAWLCYATLSVAAQLGWLPSG